MDWATALQKFWGAIGLSPESGNEEPNSKWITVIILAKEKDIAWLSDNS